jgi:mono/diheme cytochrome c family protein
VAVFVIVAAAGAGIALSANTTPPQGKTTIAFPPDARPTFKPGPGVEKAQQYCAVCHSPAYVAIQPPFTAAQWTAEVTKMQKTYGAPIPPEQVAPLVEYLTAEYGKPAAPPCCAQPCQHCP